MRIYHLTATVFLLIAAGCAVNPVTGRTDLVLMSEGDEIRLGEQVKQQVLQQYQVYDDPELQNYVQRVGSKLAANSHRSHLNYSFTVLDSKEVNAFALPGGHIYITRGLMAYLNSEAELAAVLGHEIGHVTARHAVRQYSATQLASIGITLGSLLLPGGYQGVGQQLGGILGGALLRGYGREHELESDRLGAEYLARSNYNPQAMLDVIRVLKNQESLELKMARVEGREPRVYHGLFATHPDNDTRLQEVIGYADQITKVESPYIGRQAYINRIDHLAFGDSASQGTVRGRNFYHGQLDFTLRFPADWKIINQPQRLVGQAPGTDAIVQLTLQPLDRQLTPRDFMIKTLGLKQLGNEQSRDINGLKAHSATALVDMGSGKQQMSRITAIYYGDSAYILVGLTRDPAAFGRYDEVFLETAGTFRPMTKADREAAKPLSVKIIEAGKGTSYPSLAQASPLEKYAEEQLRLLNGDFPKGSLQPGEKIKVIE